MRGIYMQDHIDYHRFIAQIEFIEKMSPLGRKVYEKTLITINSSLIFQTKDPYLEMTAGLTSADGTNA